MSSYLTVAVKDWLTGVEQDLSDGKVLYWYKLYLMNRYPGKSESKNRHQQMWRSTQVVKRMEVINDLWNGRELEVGEPGYKETISIMRQYKRIKWDAIIMKSTFQLVNDHICQECHSCRVHLQECPSCREYATNY